MSPRSALWIMGAFNEPAADHRDFGNLHHAAVCAESTRFCQVEGGCTKGCQHDQRRKAKTEAYCQINKLAEQIGKTDQEKDSKKAEALSRQAFELEIKMGPEYIALANNLKDVDPNSPQGKEIDSILQPLDDSCDNDDEGKH